jgi:hypothetical protein
VTLERCPICGGSSWTRENLVVINAPMSGEVHPVVVDTDGPVDWSCETCGWTMQRPALEAAVLDGVMDRARHAPRTRRHETPTPQDP